MSRLHDRLNSWAGVRGWAASFVPSDEPTEPFAYEIGPVKGYGRSEDEAANNAADGLVPYGWLDDR